MVHPKLSKVNWLIVAILLIASFFRLYRISDYMEFLGDQGRDVVIVRDFIQQGDLFFIGPQTSIGNMYLGPFYYYLIAPSLLIANYSPVGPSVFVALLGILTTYLIFRFSSSWFGYKSGIIASFLYAISPTVIKYSDFSWNPNVMPFFSLLFFYYLYRAFASGQFSFLLLASLSFIMALNSHYLALLLLIPAFLYWSYHLAILVKKKSADSRKLIIATLLALAIFVISLIPQILFDIKHQGQNINSIITFFSNRESTVSIKAYKSIPNLWPLFQQINTSLLTAKNVPAGTIISLIFIIGLIIVYFKNRHQANFNSKAFFLLLIWYLSGLIGLGLYKQHIYDHYFGFLFPVVFILFALVIQSLLNQKYTKFIAIITIVWLSYLLLSNNAFRYSPPSQLKNVSQIVSFIIQQSDSKPFNFALLAKQNYDPPYKYFLSQYQANYFDLHDQMTDQLFVVCEPWQIDCNPINNPQWEVAAFGWGKIDQQWDYNSVKIYRVLHNK